MSDANGSATVTGLGAEDIKGKGKAPAEPSTHDVSMDTGDDSSSEEELEEGALDADEDDPDNMEEIDRANIIDSERRTRGRKIDFVAAAKDLPEDEDDEDDDDDFQAPVDDKMDEN